MKFVLPSSRICCTSAAAAGGVVLEVSLVAWEVVYVKAALSNFAFSRPLKDLVALGA
jgi:hypothetical protein